MVSEVSSYVLSVGQCRLLGELLDVGIFIPYKAIIYYTELGLFIDLAICYQPGVKSIVKNFPRSCPRLLPCSHVCGYHRMLLFQEAVRTWPLVL